MTGACPRGSSESSVCVYEAVSLVICDRDYQFDTVVLLNLILFKAADSLRDIYEVAMQLLQVQTVFVLFHLTFLKGHVTDVFFPPSMSEIAC